MTLYDACLRRTLAAAPHEIANWPDAVLQSEAARWLEQDYDLYLLSELAKHADLQLPQPRVEFHLYRALETGRVDDFCFLHKRMRPVLNLDRGRLTAGCVRLAITGNVGGLEAVVAVTGVEVRLTEREALQAYDALAVMGRPAAMEYVRQLSGTPIACAEANAQAGYRLLLMTGNYERLSELRRVTGVVPELDRAELDSRCGSLEAALQFRELRRLVEATGTVVRFDGFAARAGALMVDGDVLELPALFALCGDARPDDVPIEALGLLATSDDCDAVSFLYDTSGFAPTRLLFADVAYATAAGAQDWRLARRVCEASDRTPDPEHREPMLGAALSTTDVGWLVLLARQGPLPGGPAVLLQAFLARVARLADSSRLRAAEELLGLTLDTHLGDLLNRLERGEDLPVRHLVAIPDIDAHLGGSGFLATATLSPVAGQASRPL